MMASPLAVFAFAGDDVVDFDCLRELLTVTALIPGTFFLDVGFGVCPTMIASVLTTALAATPCFLAARQFLVAQFASVGVTFGGD